MTMSAIERTVIRHPRSMYLVIGFVALCATAIVRSPLQALIYVIPLVAIVFVVRTATIVDNEGITSRGLLGSTTVTWSDLAGLRIDPSGSVWAVSRGGGELRLPVVRHNSLNPLVRASGGRIPDLTA